MNSLGPEIKDIVQTACSKKIAEIITRVVAIEDSKLNSTKHLAEHYKQELQKTIDVCEPFFRN